MEKLTIRENRFIDKANRQIILHGIGLVDKNPKNGYLAYNNPEIFRNFREWGFNCVRLGILWDGLEPKPGKINETYLQGIDQQIQSAREHGIFVFLDMHQDLYSVQFSDGAPSWATLTDDQPHIEASEVWSDAYFTSPAVQTALDHFWNNSPAEDGIGLQDHFTRVWKHIAERYQDTPTVMGYDLFNEPQPGQLASLAQQAMFTKGAEILAASGLLDEELASLPEGIDPVEGLMHFWLSPEGRFTILQILGDMELYKPIIDAQQPFYNQFEQEKLMPLYNKVAQAIRTVDSDSLIFLETTMASNMGVYTAIEPVKDINGIRDTKQVYAPHGYDLVTDTPNLKAASPERVELIFKRHAESAKRLNMPLLIGEWGAFGKQDGTLDPAWHVVSLFEELQCGETFWAYFDGVEKTPSFPAIQRPYPMRINGKLEHYHYDPVEKRFVCQWQENEICEQPTQIYLPAWFKPDNNIELQPETKWQIIPISENSQNRILEIQPMGTSAERTLTIRE